jgi:hypothetical protein
MVAIVDGLGAPAVRAAAFLATARSGAARAAGRDMGEAMTTRCGACGVARRGSAGRSAC